MPLPTHEEDDLNPLPPEPELPDEDDGIPDFDEKNMEIVHIERIDLDDLPGYEPPVKLGESYGQ